MKRIKTNADNEHYWIMTREQAQNEYAVVVQLPSGGYKPALEGGEVKDIRKAKVVNITPETLLAEGSTLVVKLYEELANDLALIRHTPQFECEPVRLEHVFDATTLSVLEAFPQHDLIKGTLLAKLGELPPDSALTSKDTLQQWLLENYEKPVDVETPPAISTPRRRERPPTVLSVEIDASETEYGRCQYSVTRSGSATDEWTSGDLQDLLSEALDDGKDFDGLLEMLEERATENARDNGIDMYNYGDYDYEDHESSDSDNYEEIISNSREVKRALEAWVHENATDEQLESLGL